jgi:predicted dehydrogenase
MFSVKTPAMNKEEVRRMMAASRKSGRILSFNFNYRYRREAIAIKKFVDNGDLGEVYHCEGNFLRRRGIPGWGSFSSKEIQAEDP